MPALTVTRRMGLNRHSQPKLMRPRDEREKALRKQEQRRFIITVDVRNRIAQKKRSKLARVMISGDTPTSRVLRDLVRPPEGIMSVDLADGRRVFIPVDSDPDAVRAQIESGDTASCCSFLQALRCT
jgi:hypothetical protein